MNLVWEPGNDKQGYVVCVSVSRNNGEITSTKSHLETISSKYHYHYGMVKCRQTVNFEGYWVVKWKKLWILSTVRNI